MSDWLGMAARPVPPRPELRAAVLARAARSGQGRAWAYAAAATFLLVALGVGVWARSRIEALDAARLALERRVTALEDTLALLHGRHTRVTQIPVTTGGRLGSVTIFEDTLRHRWLVRCEHLARNEPDEAYQLWFVTPQGVRPAHLMAMDSEEPMSVVLEMPDDGAPVRGAAMSIEPRTGSAEPTGPLVFRLVL
jgi:hypothetical protein